MAGQQNFFRRQFYNANKVFRGEVTRVFPGVLDQLDKFHLQIETLQLQ